MTTNPRLTNRAAGIPSVYLTAEARHDPGPPRWLAPDGASTLAVMLGSGKPEPTPFRNGPGGAVVVDGVPYLIDAGEGVWRGIAKAAMSHGARLADAFAPRRLTRVFLTHLHSDHTIGLPSLMFLPWTCGKDQPLEVHGPIGAANLVEGILEAYRGDVVERVKGPEGKEDQGWRAAAHEIEEPGVVYCDERVEVEAFLRPHGGFEQSFGYRFRTADRTIVWAGDGVGGRSFADAAAGADLLFSDVCATDYSNELTPWRSEADGHSQLFHIESRHLGRLAARAGVGTLVLHHEQNYSDPFNPDALVEEARETFQGPVISARDGDVF